VRCAVRRPSSGTALGTADWPCAEVACVSCKTRPDHGSRRGASTGTPWECVSRLACGGPQDRSCLSRSSSRTSSSAATRSVPAPGAPPLAALLRLHPRVRACALSVRAPSAAQRARPCCTASAGRSPLANLRNPLVSLGHGTTRSACGLVGCRPGEGRSRASLATAWHGTTDDEAISRREPA
jgi:hypothetical protein